MDPGFQRPMRIVVAAGWLALAWSHLFWGADGIYGAAAAALPERMRPEPGALAGSRIGLGFGTWFLAGGTLAVAGQPGWLVRAVLGLGLLPALGWVAARAAGAAQPVAAGLAESWLWWAPAGLLWPADRASGARAGVGRIGLGLVFGGVAASCWASGGFPWETENPGGWRVGWPEGVPWALVPGIVVAVSWAALWVRPLALAGTVGLGCVGLASAVAWFAWMGTTGEGEGAAAILERWHRAVPEAVLLLGAAALPWACREHRPRRRLRRVGTEEGAGAAGGLAAGRGLPTSATKHP
jgi:hypothetical protein